jgi:hypothetical protein
MKPVNNNSVLRRWLRFLLGLAALTAFFGFFASGWTPPGPAGTVLRSNRQLGIDASPLFYSDLENMPQIEADVRALRQAAESGACREQQPD